MGHTTPGRLDTRELSDTVLDLAVVVPGLFRPSVLSTGNGHAEGIQPGRVETGVHALHSDEALHEQSSADQQHDRQRNLGDDQCVSGLPARGSRRAAVAELRTGVGPQRHRGRERSDQKRDEHRHAGGERQDRPFNAIVSRSGKPGGASAGIARMPHAARSSPAAAPAMARKRLSSMRNRPTRARGDPSAIRTAISRRRAWPRTSNRFATLHRR